MAQLRTMQGLTTNKQRGKRHLMHSKDRKRKFFREMLEQAARQAEANCFL